MRTGRNNKNGGFSLVELIIVVAIMAIVVGVIGLSVGTLTGRKIAKCADEIVSTLERARVLTLGKEQNQVEFVLTDVSGAGVFCTAYFQSDAGSCRSPRPDRQLCAHLRQRHLLYCSL
jgi:prepilin-type N-terminal cleavage/methylation domain-containing protein